MILATVLAVLGLAAEALPGPADAAPSKAYISDFCAPIALSDADPGALRQHYASWGAKLTTEDAAVAFRPQDADVPGQMLVFDTADAPHAFVERRRQTCSLVYAGQHTPPGAMAEFQAPVKLGQRTLAWRAVTTKRFGPPGPIRYFLAASDQPDLGLCATLFEDLRLKDGAPATLVRVNTCRLASDETYDNG